MDPNLSSMIGNVSGRIRSCRIQYLRTKRLVMSIIREVGGTVLYGRDVQNSLKTECRTARVLVCLHTFSGLVWLFYLSSAVTAVQRRSPNLQPIKLIKSNLGQESVLVDIRTPIVAVYM